MFAAPEFVSRCRPVNRAVKIEREAVETVAEEVVAEALANAMEAEAVDGVDTGM